MRFIVGLGLLGLGLCLPHAARAEEPPLPEATPVELPPVVVPLPEAPPSPPSKVDPSVSRSVVRRAPYAGEAKETAELIVSAPGVSVRDVGGFGQAKSLSLRGVAPSGVLVLLDGVPLQSSGASMDLSALPAAIVERYEVLRGAGARFQSGGLGGALNVVTRSPEGGARFQAEGTYGAFDTGLLQLSGAGPLAGGAGLVVLHGGRSDGDFGYAFDPAPSIDGNPLVHRARANNHALAGGGLLKYRRGLGADTTLDVLVEGGAQSRGLAGTARNPTPDASEERWRGTAQALLTRRLASGAFSARVFGRLSRVGLEGGYFPTPLDQRELSAGVELHAEALVGAVHLLSAQAQVTREALWVEGGQGAGWGRLGVQLADEWLLGDGRLTLAPSVRVDVTGPFVGLSPRLGASLALPLGLELSASAGQSHRPPSFLELHVAQGQLLPNPALRPERALGGDVSLAWTRQEARVCLTGFYALYEDLISYEYYPPLLSKPYNFGAAQVMGAELEASFAPRPWLSAELSYTLLASQNLKDDPRYYQRELPYRPRHRAHARAVVGPAWASFLAELDAQSELAMNRTGSPVLPGRALVNVGVKSRFLRRPELTASFALKNLFDTPATDLADYPLPGRAAYLTVAFATDSPKERSSSP